MWRALEDGVIELPFVKGHGTENDFVLVPDRDGALEIDADSVRAICDRRAGIGGDGLIRVGPATDGGPGFFMDYRNADGSLAQMCGNGARVFARALVEWGWQQPGRFEFQTRGGRRGAELGAEGAVSIEMGRVRVGGSSAADLGGRVLPGVVVDVGNPHLVCHLPDDVRLADLDLSQAPGYDRQVYPEGVNVEFMTVLGPDRLAMRVFERGVGETRSCGTGTVATAAAHRRALGPGRVEVQVPGGRVIVDLTATNDSGVFEARLTGPAVLVAAGTLTINEPATQVAAVSS